MASINKVILLGRLGGDPDFKTTSNWNIPVAHFSIATHETYQDKKSGDKKEKTEWHRIVAWGSKAEWVYQEIGKGDLVFIEGKLTTHSWKDDKTGKKNYMTEVEAETIELINSSVP